MDLIYIYRTRGYPQIYVEQRPPTRALHRKNCSDLDSVIRSQFVEFEDTSCHGSDTGLREGGEEPEESEYYGELVAPITRVYRVNSIFVLVVYTIGAAERYRSVPW